MMMGNGRLGIGDATGDFITGAESWMSPGAAFTATTGALTNYSTSFSSANLPKTLGLLIVPIGLLMLVMSMGGGRHRR